MNIASQVSTIVAPHPIMGGKRWLAASIFLIGASLQVVEFLLEPGFDHPAARISWWLDHSTRVDWSQACGILAIPFLLVGAAIMWRLARADSPKIALTALIILSTAMIGLGLVHGVELAARWVAIAGDSPAAESILEASDPRLPGMVGFVMFMPMAIAGNLLLMIALLRSRFLPRTLAILLLGFVILDFAADQELIAHLTDLATGAIVAWAIVTGYQRRPRGGVPVGAQ